MMIEVFKTNVQNTSDAEALLLDLRRICKSASINFDLEDCDKILRVSAQMVATKEIISLLNQQGFSCELLV